MDDIGALVTSGLLVSLPIALICGYFAFKLIKAKLVFKILLSLSLLLAVFFRFCEDFFLFHTTELIPVIFVPEVDSFLFT
jgi:hypothetical protein